MKVKRCVLFSGNGYETVEANVISAVNGTHDIVNARSLGSPRAIGDAIQELLEARFPELLPKNVLSEYNSSFARRSMADFAFEDKDGFYCIVDNKTHNLGTAFNMPNLTSVERLARFYEDDRNYFSLLIVAYRTDEGVIKAEQCHFLPIEHLSWDCLTIGALGWGQIQIANSNKIIVNRKQTRKAWMLRLCDTLAMFYPKEIEKITRRIDHFARIREHWEAKPDY